MQLFGIILAALISYFLGNFSTGAYIARREKGSGMDIRKYGSGSSGATNVLRVVGKKAALITFAGDFLKGVIATVIGYLLGGRDGAMLCGILVVTGHIWPVLMQFKGGKGVATSIAVILVISPWQALLALAIAIGCIALTRYVSLGDMLAAFVYALAVCPWALAHGQYTFFWFGLALAALVIFAHRGNIRRLIKGSENRLDLSAFKK
ncbi:MAG TPA: glycerol-3-phosphate 1-O-acyltransferase PlsY [Clostridia bacterium]|nr:glycerol-3-phosphate 1-O-acyltransferase PlsY [Clostridia bacterium]